MTIAIDIILSVLLIVGGYVYTCYYFNNVKWNTFNGAALKFSRNKILYLLSTVIAVGVLVTLFETVYFLDTISQIKLLSLVLILFPIAAIDFRIQKIPNRLLAIALIIRILIYLVEFIVSVSEAFAILKDNLVGAVVIGAFFLLLLLIFKNSIGMGDVKLFVVMGLYQGLWGAVNSVFFSLLVSFFLSVGLLITRKKGRKDTISFGPSILLGTIIAIGLAGM